MTVEIQRKKENERIENCINSLRFSFQGSRKTNFFYKHLPSKCFYIFIKKVLNAEKNSHTGVFSPIFE